MDIRLTAAEAAPAACTTIYTHNGTAGLATDSISHKDSIDREYSLNGVTAAAHCFGTTRMDGAINGFNMNREEMFGAACCYPDKSFMSNPSVNVSYNDATTGARQIRQLELSGNYVLMMTDNLI